MVDFLCSSCGACCRRAGKLGLMPQREDGACIYLTKDNKCSIYETRPDVCRVNKMAEKNRHLLGLTTIEYYKMNNEICNKWIKEDGMDDSYLINIGSY
jgi:Fe-S-cluster containining protein